MDNQRFNKAFVITLFFTIVFIVSLNYLIDPYDVFHIKNRFNINKPHADSNQRVSKVPALKLNREKIDAIWVGSSRTGWSSNVEYESSVLNANIKNLALNGCSFYEAITMAKNAIIIHPEIKTVYFGIDFSMMNGVAETLDATRPNTKPQLTKEEVLPLLISVDAIKNSTKTLVANLKKDNDVEAVYGEEKQYNKKVFHKFKNTINSYSKGYKNFYLSKNKIADLKEFVGWSAERGIKVVFFITPMHIAEHILVDDLGVLEDFYRFKVELANIQPYFDFAVIDKYTTEEIDPNMQNFRDAIHAYPFIRKKMSNQLFGYKDDFGYFINKNNVDLHNIDTRALLIKYEIENQNLIKDVKKWSE